MSDETIAATAENLRADFLNANTTSQRWKVLNGALQWAMDASENAKYLRRQKRDIEDSLTRVQGERDRYKALLSEACNADDGPPGERVKPGEIVRKKFDPSKGDVIVHTIGGDGSVYVIPLYEGWHMEEEIVKPEDITR